MFKPLTAQLNEQFGGSPLSPALDPVKIARSFGVAYEVNESLPESPTAIRHLEDEQESSLLLDTKKRPTQLAEPKSMFVIAIARLRSVKPRTREREQQVAQLIADSQETLVAIDEMVAVLNAERTDAIEARLEELRTRGRELRKRVNWDLPGDVLTAEQIVNVAEQQKVSAQSKLQSHIDRRRALRLDRYSSNEQLVAADEKVASAVRKLNAAKESRLQAEKKKNEATNALAIATSELRGIEISMDQHLAELKGQPYHDPSTGLSVDPLAYLQQ